MWTRSAYAPPYLIGRDTTQASARCIDLYIAAIRFDTIFASRLNLSVVRRWVLSSHSAVLTMHAGWAHSPSADRCWSRYYSISTCLEPRSVGSRVPVGVWPIRFAIKSTASSRETDFIGAADVRGLSEVNGKCNSVANERCEKEKLE